MFGLLWKRCAKGKEKAAPAAKGTRGGGDRQASILKHNTKCSLSTWAETLPRRVGVGPVEALPSSSPARITYSRSRTWSCTSASSTRRAISSFCRQMVHLQPVPVLTQRPPPKLVIIISYGVDTSVCERGFALMNNLKTARRSQMGDTLLRILMTARMGTPPRFGRSGGGRYGFGGL